MHMSGMLSHAPVVPDVYMMQAVSSALGGESCAGLLLPACSSSSQVTVLICAAQRDCDCPETALSAGVH